MADTNPGGAEMMTMLMELMRNIDSRMGRLEDKFASISDERLAEAEERGAMSARVDALEGWRKSQDENTTATRRLAIGAVITTALSTVGFFAFMVWKLAAQNPQVLK